MNMEVAKNNADVITAANVETAGTDCLKTFGRDVTVLVTELLHLEMDETVETVYIYSSNSETIASMLIAAMAKRIVYVIVAGPYCVDRPDPKDDHFCSPLRWPH